MTTACIMQPTYLPWCGFFDMLDQADVFVLLDTVDVSLKSWQMRNRIRARDGNVVWLTVPTHAHRGGELQHVEISGDAWRAKHWRTIAAAYSHADHWERLAWLKDLYQPRDECLADFTSELIGRLSRCLGIDRPIYRASMLGSTRADKTGRIIDICRAVDADVLLDTPGAQAFLADAMLEPIRIDWHRYQPAPYSQGGKPWHPYLSVIDAIAWHGSDALSIIRAGRLTRPPPLALGSE